MKTEALVILCTTLGIVFFSYIILALKVVWEVRQEKRWAKSLEKSKLSELEDMLASGLKSAHIDTSNASSAAISINIVQQGYALKYKAFIPFREVYAVKKPKRDIYIRRFLPADRLHFVLARELIRVVCGSKIPKDKSLSRGAHSLFEERNERRQNQDYMAASLILQKDAFWDEIVKADYFNLPVRERKEFAFQAAQKYNVEPSVVFRRISELKVLNNYYLKHLYEDERALLLRGALFLYILSFYLRQKGQQSEYFNVDHYNKSMVKYCIYKYSRNHTQKGAYIMRDRIVSAIETILTVLIAIGVILAAIMCSYIVVYGDPDVNVDHGGGSVGTGTSEYMWANHREGIRVSVYDTELGQTVGMPRDYSNATTAQVSSWVDFWWGNHTKLYYTGGKSLSRSSATYRTYQVRGATIPEVITDPSVTTQEIKQFFRRTDVIQNIAEDFGVSYETLISGKYKLLLEPVVYVVYEGKGYCFSATEIAVFELYHEPAPGTMKNRIGAITHQNAPLSMFLEYTDIDIPAWSGPNTGKRDARDILYSLGIGIISFRDEPPIDDPNGNNPTGAESHRNGSAGP